MDRLESDIRDDCGVAETTVRHWVETGEMAREESAVLCAHMRECRRCRTRYSWIESIINGRLRGEYIETAPRPADPAGLSQAVMDRIGLDAGGSRRALIRGVGLAAAAILLFVAGMTATGVVSGIVHPNTVTVRFELAAPGAREVSLVGDFNEWRPNTYVLHDRDGDGVWEIRLRLERNVYLYNFIIDGDEWVTDPGADIQVDDGFGGKNSMMRL